MVKIYVNEEYCKGCEYCVALCPFKVLEMSKELGPRGYFPVQVVKLEACNVCRVCEMICPDFAIAVEE